MEEEKVGGRKEEENHQQGRKPPWTVNFKFEVGGAAGMLLLSGALLVGAVAVAWKARRARVHREVEEEKEENEGTNQDLDQSDVDDIQENGSGYQTEEALKNQVQVDKENSTIENEESEAELRNISGENIEEGNRSDEGSDRTVPSSADSNSELNDKDDETENHDESSEHEEEEEDEDDDEGDRNMMAITHAPKITRGFFPMIALALANCFIPPPK